MSSTHKSRIQVDGSVTTYSEETSPYTRYNERSVKSSEVSCRHKVTVGEGHLLTLVEFIEENAFKKTC